jgi:hypothetical protein
MSCPPLGKRPRRPLVHAVWIGASHLWVVFLRVREYVDGVSVQGTLGRYTLYVPDCSLRLGSAMHQRMGETRGRDADLMKREK